MLTFRIRDYSPSSLWGTNHDNDFNITVSNISNDVIPGGIEVDAIPFFHIKFLIFINKKAVYLSG